MPRSIRIRPILWIVSALILIATVSSGVALSADRVTSRYPAYITKSSRTMGHPSRLNQPRKLTTVRWIFDWLPTALNVPILAATKFGWFTQKGIKLKVTPGGTTGDQITLVGAGRQDITIGTASSFAVTASRGLPVTAIGVVLPVNPTGLICRPDRGINPNNPKSIDGKKIGILAQETSYGEFKAWAKATGIDRSTLTEIPVGFDPIVLFQDKVDCYPTFITYTYTFVRQFKQKVPTFVFSDRLGTIGQTLVVNNSFARRYPAAVAGFVWAYAKGIQWALKNRQKAVDLVSASYPQLKKADNKAELSALPRFLLTAAQRKRGILWQTDSTWRREYNVLRGAGYLKEDFSFKSLAKAVSGRYLPNPPVLP